MTGASRPGWQQLLDAAARCRTVSVAGLFDTEPERARQMRVEAAGLTLDFGKQRLDAAALAGLREVASSHQLSDAFARLTEGAALNLTEERPALHTLLRGTRKNALPSEYSLVENTLASMRALVTAIHQGQRRGFDGQQFEDVVNIGIGGSDLGPRMVCRALNTPDPKLKAHFVANVDPQDLDEVLAPLNPATTLFIVCSKSFTTEETLTNALRARQWLIDGGARSEDVGRHVVAVTTNLTAANAFGIASEECYPLWDWVGGRYSLWSAIGLVIALHRGWGDFEALLGGARALDEHTLSSASEQNLPLTLALLEYWNTLFLETETHLVLPYSQRLSELPDFLQQLTMESNGKRVDLAGNPVEGMTAPVLWGSAGTIGQHSYYQLLHQGTRPFSADILLPLTNGPVNKDAHCKLAANALAQSRAFMVGRSPQEARTLATSRGQDSALAPHFELPGSHPHSLLLMDAVTPASLGALIAAYEHKTFFLSRLLDINAYDQWGVELGKVIGKQVLHTLETGDNMSTLDPSTAWAAQAWRDANT